MTAVVIEAGPDAGAVAHYGDPLREQRRILAGEAAVDWWHRDVIAVAGPERLSWLHALTSQHLTDLQPGAATTALVLDPNGRIEFGLAGVDDGSTFWAHTEPGRGAALVAWLASMVFMTRVTVELRSDLGVVWRPEPFPGVANRPGDLGGFEAIVADAEREAALGPVRAGVWAAEALRIAAGLPRIGLDTDERTIPNEIGLIGTHLDKGCYRGQETVGRVHTLGRPPRRLVRLSLDGSMNALPALGESITLDGRDVGRVGTSARHFEEGPIALGLVKRNVPVAAELVIGDIAAAQEALVDPDVGLHVRPRLG